MKSLFNHRNGVVGVSPVDGKWQATPFAGGRLYKLGIHDDIFRAFEQGIKFQNLYMQYGRTWDGLPMEDVAQIAMDDIDDEFYCILPTYAPPIDNTQARMIFQEQLEAMAYFLPENKYLANFIDIASRKWFKVKPTPSD